MISYRDHSETMLPTPPDLWLKHQGILLSFLSGAFLVTYGHATGDAGAMGNWAQFPSDGVGSAVLVILCSSN